MDTYHLYPSKRADVVIKLDILMVIYKMALTKRKILTNPHKCRICKDTRPIPTRCPSFSIKCLL